MPYREVTIRGTALLCFPAHDRAFAALAVGHLRESPDAGAEALERWLRLTYPQAIVRRRETLASLVGGEAWYVYRDGRYSPFEEHDGRWWEEPGCALLVIETSSGRYVDANDAALELLATDRATVLALRSGDLTDPAAQITVAWVWKLLEDAGELHSTSLLRTPSGRVVPVEYHLVRDGAGPGLSISWLRPAPVEAAASSDDRGDGTHGAGSEGADGPVTGRAPAPPDAPVAAVDRASSSDT